LADIFYAFSFSFLVKSSSRSMATMSWEILARRYNSDSRISELQIFKCYISALHISEPTNCRTLKLPKRQIDSAKFYLFYILYFKTFIMSSFCLFEHLAQTWFSEI
jgi:hypothetical protein